MRNFSHNQCIIRVKELMEIDALEGFGMSRVVVPLFNIMKHNVHSQDEKVWAYIKGSLVEC